MATRASTAQRPTIDVPRRTGGLRGRLGVHPGLPAIVVAALVFPRTASAYWVFVVTVGLVLAISCLGLLAVVGWAREISLMQAGLTGSALYITDYFASGQWGGAEPLPFPVAAAYGIGFALVVSLSVSMVSMRLAGAYVAVLTLSVQFLLENSIMLAERFTGGLSAPAQPRPDFFGVSLKSDKRFYYVVLGALIVSMVFLYRFRHSRFGRSMIMAGSDPQAAAAVGISPWRYRVWAFAIAGLLAGVAGALSGPLYFSPPGTLQFISFNSLFYLSIPVLAGCDSLMTVVGLAVLFTLLPQLFLDAKLNVYLLGGVGLALGVVLGPRGIGGALADLFEGRPLRRRSEERTWDGDGGDPPAGAWDGSAAIDIGGVELG